jgi:hypothetical protein
MLVIIDWTADNPETASGSGPYSPESRGGDIYLLATPLEPNLQGISFPETGNLSKESYHSMQFFPYSRSCKVFANYL